MMKAKIAFLKDMLGDTIGTIDNETIWMHGAAAEGNSEAENCHCENIIRLEKRKRGIQYIIERFEEQIDAHDFFCFDIQTLTKLEYELSTLHSAEKRAQTEYTELISECLKEICRVWTCEKFMITKMSIINRLKKEEFRVTYTEEEKPCNEAFLDKIKDCTGEECTRYFIILDNHITALEKLRAETGTSIMLTENKTFDCPELVFFDENLDNDYYLS